MPIKDEMAPLSAKIQRDAITRLRYECVRRSSKQGEHVSQGDVLTELILRHLPPVPMEDPPKRR